MRVLLLKPLPVLMALGLCMAMEGESVCSLLTVPRLQGWGRGCSSATLACKYVLSWFCATRAERAFAMQEALVDGQLGNGIGEN